jgi:hypothetical protein
MEEAATSASPRTNMPNIPSQEPFFSEPVPPSIDGKMSLLWEVLQTELQWTQNNCELC